MTAPINAYTWTFGAIPIIILCYRGLKSYRQAGNPLSLMYVIIAFTVSLGFLLIGIPPFFTSKSSILIITYYLATIVFLLSLQAQTWLLWFIGLRKYISLKKLLLASGIFALVILGLQIGTSHAIVEYNPHLVQYTDAPDVLIFKSAFYILIAVPISYFFINQARVQKEWLVKSKSLITAAVFLTVCAAAVSTNILYKGGDSVSSSRIIDIVFTIILLGSIIPHGHTKTKLKITK